MYLIRHNEQEYLKKLYGIQLEMHLLFMDSVLQRVDKILKIVQNRNKTVTYSCHNCSC